MLKVQESRSQEGLLVAQIYALSGPINIFLSPLSEQVTVMAPEVSISYSSTAPLSIPPSLFPILFYLNETRGMAHV